jgi:hypothetical protein
MLRRLPERVRKIVYWTVLSHLSVFSVFAVWAAVSTLRASVSGQIDGGIAVNVGLSALALAWVTFSTSLVVALWNLRDMKRPLQVWELALMPQPKNSAEAIAWTWLRIAAVAWLVLMTLGFSGLLRGL